MGLNFQTCTIINSNLDPDSGLDVNLFEGVEDKMIIKRDFVFYSEGVKALRKRAGYDAVACEATIDFSEYYELQPTEAEPKKYGRLDINLGVEGAEPYIYSRPDVKKSIPFWVEFTITELNKNNIAEHIADMINKDKLFVIDKNLIKVTADGNVLTLQGTTEYQRFRDINVHIYDTFYSEKIDSIEIERGINIVERGKNSFGTYSQLVKDLRLPTAANYGWLHTRQVETPVVGAIYTQYIIEYMAPSVNQGNSVVGERNFSHTTHVFWVKDDVVSDWESALINAFGEDAIEDVDQDVDQDAGQDDQN